MITRKDYVDEKRLAKLLLKRFETLQIDDTDTRFKEFTKKENKIKSGQSSPHADSFNMNFIKNPITIEHRIVRAVWQKTFHNFKDPIHCERYDEHVEIFLSTDINNMKDVLFQLMDYNRDGKIDEEDLFNFHKEMTNSPILSASLLADWKLVNQFIQKKRDSEGLSDAFKLKQ